MVLIGTALGGIAILTQASWFERKMERVVKEVIELFGGQVLGVKVIEVLIEADGLHEFLG